MGNDPHKAHLGFNGIAWFRKHIEIDSTLVNIPLALAMTHFGASEIYVDGKLVASFGKIAGNGSSEYLNPQNIPFIIVLPQAGKHVIAVRYANFNTLFWRDKYNTVFAGFRMTVSNSANAIATDRHLTISNTVIFILLFSIFIALSFLHFLLYLFFRELKSNLYFSMFSFSLSVVFLLPFFSRFSTKPETQFNTSVISIIAGILVCFSLSGFINELFGHRKWRFYIVSVVSAVGVFCAFISHYFLFVAGALLVFLITFVSVEAVILIVSAIIRKVKGARIIGTGILLFALLFILIVVSSVFTGSFDIDDSTPEGKIVALFTAISILSIPISQYPCRFIWHGVLHLPTGISQHSCSR